MFQLSVDGVNYRDLFHISPETYFAYEVEVLSIRLSRSALRAMRFLPSIRLLRSALLRASLSFRACRVFEVITPPCLHVLDQALE
jgi:hypothetical protein